MNLSFSGAGKRLSHPCGALLPALSFVMLALVGGKNASAATFTVNTKADTTTSMQGCTGSDACSLREAITASNATTGGGVNAIVFDATAFANPQTIIIKHGDLPAITHDLILTGPTTQRAALTIVPRAEDEGTGLTVANGRVKISAFSISGFSTAIDAQGGQTLVQSCSIYGTEVAIAISSKRPGTLVAQNCTLFDNSVGLYSVNTPRSGSPIYTPGTLRSCTVAGNEFGIANSDQVNVGNSIVAANEYADIIGPINDEGTNITNGTPDDLALDPNGLQDNGGPTPTLALLADSPAINAGHTSLTTDQRGAVRDSRPDIGAFEFVNVAPTVDAITPQGATDKVGDKRTFELTVSDDNGVSDISDVFLAINDHLDTSSGAVIYYAARVGLLYLIQGNRFVGPIHTGQSATSREVLDNGVVRIAGRDVTLDTSNDGHSLRLSIPATIESGLIGRNTLFGSVADLDGKTDPKALASDFGFVRFGPYTVTTALPNSAPTLSRLTPSKVFTTLDASGVSPGEQTFGFFAQDQDGAGDIRTMLFSAGKTPGGKNSATFICEPRTNRLFLLSDDAKNSFSGQIGAVGILENSQVKVDLSKVKLQRLGDGKSLGLVLPLQAKTGLVGQNNIWLRVADSSGITSAGGDSNGYVDSGSWLVKPGSSPTPPPALSGGSS